MIDFTILFNSRGRVGLLQNMLQCIQNTTHNLEGIEVLINFDDDDHPSINALPLLEDQFPFIKPRINPREVNIHINVNKIAFEAEGKYIWGLGDDCFIITDGWDKIALEKFDSYLSDKPDRIAMGAVDSTSVDKDQHMMWYTDAPIITKEGRDTLGFLIHPFFISLGADVATNLIYHGVDRIVDMKEIVFDHTTHNTVEKVINPDQTAFEYRQRQAERQVLNPWTYDYSHEIGVLKRRTTL